MLYLFDWNNPEKDIKLFLSQLWDIEYFNPFDAKESATIAYLLDRIYKSQSQNEYMNVAENLFRWLTTTTWNEFALHTAYKTNELMQEDPAIDNIDLKIAQQRYDSVLSDCKSGKNTTFWMLDEKYAPDWFPKIWSEWAALKETQMRTRFVENFNALRWDNECAEDWYNRFKNQDPQLLCELDQCLRRKKYKENCALGYQAFDGTFTTAKLLSLEYSNESIIGVYIRVFLLRQ
jgi:hypothetical protein